MSPKPDHSSHGQTYQPGNLWNTWTKDTKTKTAKCRVCEKKVNEWSWVCNRCGKRVCSVCCEHDPTGSDYHKQCAKDSLEQGCWCRRFINGYNGAMDRFKSNAPPLKQEEQLAKDREAKKKAMETSAKKKAAAAGGDSVEGSSGKRRGISEESSELSELEDSGVSARKASPTMLRPRAQRQAYQETASDEDLYNDSGEEFRPDARSSRKRRRTVVESDEEEDADSPAARPQKGKGKSKQTKTPSSNLIHVPLGKYLDGFVDEHGEVMHSKYGKKGKPKPSPDGKKAKPSQKKKKAKKTSHLEGGHSIIVGAGIVGLFTAYELANRCVADGISHSITVVEIRNVAAELASGMCAGLISGRNIPVGTEWQQLLSEADAGWRGGLSNANLDDIGFVEGQTYFANDRRDSDDDGDTMPDWFRPSRELHVGEDGELMGRINTRDMATWLEEQCRGMDVQFLLGRTVEAVEEQDGGYEVTVGDPARPGQASSTYLCTEIVLSAGPFTTSIAKDILNGGQRTGLQNRCQNYLWFDSKLDKAVAKAKVAVAVKTTDAWSAETLTILVRPRSRALEISAAEAATTCVNVLSSSAANAPGMLTTPLEDLAARKYLGGVNRQVVGRGGAVVSVARGRQPYVGVLQMQRPGFTEATEMPHIWLSYGFGRFGTTLAPGAARTLVEMMVAQQ